MKTIRFFAMMVAMLAISVGLSSCSEDDGDSPVVNPLEGTHWSYSEDAVVNGITVVYEHSFSFSSSSAVYKITETQQKGNESYSNFETVDYAYELSDDGGLVVFTPRQAGKAILEGKIQSGMKMTVTNVSMGNVIGVFYKK